MKEVPTLEAFQARFLGYSEVNNKPSTVYAKRWVLREHLVPAFGRRRLDAIGPADIEAYKARKLREGQKAKSLNNHLAVLALHAMRPAGAESAAITAAPSP